MPLTENDLTEGVKGMDKILESLKDMDTKETLDEGSKNLLHKKLEKYGIIKPFRVGTSIGVVKHKLNTYKTNFESKIKDYDISSRTAKLNTPSKKEQPESDMDKIMSSPEMKRLLELNKK